MPAMADQETVSANWKAMLVRERGTGQSVGHSVGGHTGDADARSAVIGANDFVVQSPLEAEIVDQRGGRWSNPSW